MLGDQSRNHLGVGGDLTREREAVHDAKIGVVVDVSIQRGDDVGTLGIGK